MTRIQRIILAGMIGLTGTAPCRAARLNRIFLYGNTHLEPAVILRELRIHEGDSLTPDLLKTERAWLLRQKFLKNIEFQLMPECASGRTNLILVVREKQGWSPSPILGRNSVFGWYGGLHLETNPWPIRRQRLRLTLQAGGHRLFQFLWQDPWFAGSLRLFWEIRAWYTSFPYHFSDHPPGFEEQDTGIEAQIGHQFGRLLQAGIRSGLESIRTGERVIMRSGTQTDRLVSAGIFADIDTRDWPVWPREGIRVNGWTRWYSPEYGDDFSQSGLDFQGFIPVRRHTLAVQTIFRKSHGNVPVYKRFHAASDRAVRGYRFGEFAGDNLLAATVEYRFPIFSIRQPVQGLHIGYGGVLFFDTGAAWYQHESPEKIHFQEAAGIGLQGVFRDWAVRFEYGHHFHGWGFFTYGTSLKF